MWFGVESGSEEYRRRYLGRRMSNARILEAATTARRHGIKRMIFGMVGMPFESRKDVRSTLEFCREIGAELTIVSQFMPFPGTPLYELCRAHDLLLEPSAEQQVWPLGTLNVREHAGGLTCAAMAEVAAEVMDAVTRWNLRDQ